MFKEITVRNLLSFGPDTPALPLENLNVLIGPNGSGKSNLLEAIRLLRGCPHRDSHLGLRSVISNGGTISEWIWKGNPNSQANIDCLQTIPYAQKGMEVTHSISLIQEHHSFEIANEYIQIENPLNGLSEPYQLYDFQGGEPVVNMVEGLDRMFRPATVSPEFSVLAQLHDAERYPELSYMTSRYGKIRIYSNWEFGRNPIFRTPQRADLRTDRLEEDFSNLGLFLNRLRSNPTAKAKLLTHLTDLYDGINDFDVIINGGTVQVYFTEGSFTIPATRLSDGTLHYLCILALLCDPEPPPLIGIDEPELGLHPDVLPKLAELLIDASTRTQLIVTTHSDILVDALSESPGSVVVCEKHCGQTTMQRLNPEEVAPWLEKYRLGELWTRGDIGGNRW